MGDCKHSFSFCKSGLFFFKRTLDWIKIQTNFADELTWTHVADVLDGRVCLHDGGGRGPSAERREGQGGAEMAGRIVACDRVSDATLSLSLSPHGAASREWALPCLFFTISNVNIATWRPEPLPLYTCGDRNETVPPT